MQTLSRLAHLQLRLGKLLVGARYVAARVREVIAVAGPPHRHHGSPAEPVLRQHLEKGGTTLPSSKLCCQP